VLDFIKNKWRKEHVSCHQSGDHHQRKKVFLIHHSIPYSSLPSHILNVICLLTMPVDSVHDHPLLSPHSHKCIITDGRLLYCSFMSNKLSDRTQSQLLLFQRIGQKCYFSLACDSISPKSHNKKYKKSILFYLSPRRSCDYDTRRQYKIIAQSAEAHYY